MKERTEKMKIMNDAVQELQLKKRKKMKMIANKVLYIIHYDRWLLILEGERNKGNFRAIKNKNKVNLSRLKRRKERIEYVGLMKKIKNTLWMKRSQSLIRVEFKSILNFQKERRMQLIVHRIKVILISIESKLE